MSKRRYAVEMNAGQPAEQVAAEIIASLGGDARAALIELVLIVRALIEENQALAAAASPGYARRGPLDVSLKAAAPVASRLARRSAQNHSRAIQLQFAIRQMPKARVRWRHRENEREEAAYRSGCQHGAYAQPGARPNQHRHHRPGCFDRQEQEAHEGEACEVYKSEKAHEIEQREEKVHQAQATGRYHSPQNLNGLSSGYECVTASGHVRRLGLKPGPLQAGSFAL
jgi:hypothetical protein